MKLGKGRACSGVAGEVAGVLGVVGGDFRSHHSSKQGKWLFSVVLDMLLNFSA